MRTSPGSLRLRGALGTGAALALLAGSAVPALAGAPAHPCGMMVTGPGGPRAFYLIDTIFERNVSCRAARTLVRQLNARAAAGKIPDRILTPYNPRTRVLVYDRYGPSYRFGRYRCRFENYNPGSSKFLPGHSWCRTSAGNSVTWNDRGSGRKPRG
jgi:hypothetical protein